MTETTPITFAELDLDPDIAAGLAARGFTHPTEVQTLAIPRVLQGRDLVVQSRTGTGKTLAYGIPILQKVDPAWKRVQALVLCPTRELALQGQQALQDLARSRALRVVALYGGDSMKRQMDDIHEPPQIVTATPGRLLDHLRRRTLSLSDCFYVVLDEADEMLSMGFYEEVEQIFRHLPRDRQTLLFSATIPQTVLSVAYRYMDDPDRLSLSDDYLSVREIDHAYLLTTEMDKGGSLAKILEFEDPDSCIVFCNTRDEARRTAGYLKGKGFGADLISGELSQKERERVMRRIKAGKLKIMVATDVAARGIDVVGLSHVICYSTSESPEVYIHRTGRTGRVGRKGKAISLVSGRDLHSFNRTEKANGLKIQEIDLPADDQLKEIRAERMWEKLKAYAQEHEFDSEDEIARLLPRIREDSEEGQSILFALLKHFFEERKFREKAEPIAVEAPEEDPDATPIAEAAPPPRGRRGEGRGRGRRDESRSTPERSPRTEGDRPSRSRSRRGRDDRPAANDQEQTSIVLAVGTAHGVEAAELEQLVKRKAGRDVVVGIRILDQESLLTVPARASIDILDGLAEESLRGKRLMPMHLVGDPVSVP